MATQHKNNIEYCESANGKTIESHSQVVKHTWVQYLPSHTWNITNRTMDVSMLDDNNMALNVHPCKLFLFNLHTFIQSRNILIALRWW